VTNAQGVASCEIRHFISASEGIQVATIVFHGDPKGRNHHYGPTRTMAGIRL
jgi:hypothetical protein